jgi:hypothetical protein
MANDERRESLGRMRRETKWRFALLAHDAELLRISTKRVEIKATTGHRPDTRGGEQ